MCYLGIDASLTSTGLCVYRAKGDFLTSLIKPGNLRGPERLNFCEKKLKEFLDRYPDIRAVALEGYAMGIRGGRVFDIGEWGGLIRLELWRRGIPTLVVPPATLKKFLAAGKLEKNKVLLQVYKTYGKDCGTDDEADALVLSDMARHFYNNTQKLPERQKEALEKSAIMIPIVKLKMPCIRDR